MQCINDDEIDYNASYEMMRSINSLASLAF